MEKNHGKNMQNMQNMLNEADDVSWCSCTPHKLLYARMYNPVRYVTSAGRLHYSTRSREPSYGTSVHGMVCDPFIHLFSLPSIPT